MAGAALSDPYSKNCRLREAFNISLGRTLEFPRNGETTEQVFVTDGGFADNLAAYPLVQRLCQTIIVVDGEHDPNMQFESMRRLDLALSLEGGGATSLPQSACAELSGTHALDIADPKAKLGACSEKQSFSADKLSTPVFSAELGRYPCWDVGSANGLVQLSPKIVYVKLGLDGEKIQCEKTSSASLAFERRYCGQVGSGQRGCKGQGLLEDCSFPQQSTVHQCFSSEDFTAYRTLGRQYGAQAAELTLKVLPSNLNAQENEFHK